MADAVVAPVETPVEVQEAPKVEEVKLEAPKEDLVSRVSKVKIEKEVKKEEPNPFGLSKEDYDRVQNDPSLSKFYKSMQSDYIKKTQEAAEIKRQAEEIKKQSSTWTKERLASEVNKPDFIQAAQEYASLQNPPNSGLTNEEYSALTDKEKAQLTEMRQQMNQLQMQNFQMHQKQQDELLKTKYANYAPDIVDTTISKLVNKEALATREDIWKVVDYDNAVQRAYELGRQDRISETQEKQQSASFEGINATPNKEVAKIEQGESNSKYFQRIARERLKEAHFASTQRR